jgi:hypothetical protein
MDLSAVIFIPALVGSAICGFLFLVFAANYYLTVLESTGAGGKEVAWQSEPITDNFWKVFYLGWLVGLWLGPALFVGRAFASGADAGWLAYAVPILFIWALFPISQLSSLSASSIWIPLHPDVLARLAQKPVVTVGFYLLTLPLFALLGVAFKWAFMTKGEWHLMFVGVPLVAVCLLMYARLVGRLAFALMFTRAILARKKKKKPKKQEEDAGDEEGELEPTFAQPDELPPLTTPLDGELTGYNVLTSDDPPAPKKRVKAQIAEEEPAEEPLGVIEPDPLPRPRPAARRKQTQSDARTGDDEDDRTPYDMNPPEVVPEERIPEEVVKPMAEEMALLDRSDAPKPPKRVWTAELLTFLPQPGTLMALTILTVIGLLAGVMVRVARDFNPVESAG